MQQVKIYIETDSSSPKATEKHYGYVLEVMVSGQAVTREGFGKITGTYHQTVQTALAKALDRFNHSCEICTEDDFVLNMLERNLAIWAGNEFLTSKRKPVANQQEWMEIWRLSNRHLILTEPGKHEYTGWLQGEIEKRKRDNDGIQDHDHEISADVSKSCSMKKREYTRSQSSASDWTNSRQKERYYRKWENRQRTVPK